MRDRKLPAEADELCLVAGVRVTMVEEITVPKYGQMVTLAKQEPVGTEQSLVGTMSE